MTPPRQVTVLDYGMGNLRSVTRALEAAGASVRVADTVAEARGAERVVVPGQGAFAEAMRRLNSTGLADVLREHWASDRPYLGICLGLQILLDESDEHGPVSGFGLVSGRVERIPEGTEPDGHRLKIPHMGWNEVSRRVDHPVFAWGDQAPHFYFVHSYVARPTDPADVALSTHHGIELCAGVARGNHVAVQFHPEKSQRPGLALLERFLEL